MFTSITNFCDLLFFNQCIATRGCPIHDLTTVCDKQETAQYMQCHYQVIVQNNDSNVIKEIVKIHILQPEADQYMILKYTNTCMNKNIYLHYVLKKTNKIKVLHILIILANMHMNKKKTIMEYRATNCLSPYLTTTKFDGGKGDSQVLD